MSIEPKCTYRKKCNLFKKNSAIASNVWHLPVDAEDWNEKSVRVGIKVGFGGL